MTAEDSPFVDLPAALVEEMLYRTTEVGDHLLGSFRALRSERETRRNDLMKRDMVLHESALGYPALPTTCATDGAYAIERLLTMDLAAAVAVAVEGLTPPSEQRFWEEPRHVTFVAAESHHTHTAIVLRGLMLGMELQLAARAPHEVVLMDGTLTLPIVEFNLSLHAAFEARALECSRRFLAGYPEYLQAYATILASERSDRSFAALPKYSTRREVGSVAGWSDERDDRGLLTLLLQPGELTQPLPLEPPRTPWQIDSPPREAEEYGHVRELTVRLAVAASETHVLYYKPHQWLPALRIEVPRAVAANTHRLAAIVQGIKHQCATTAMLEPYPLYLADRTVKSVARAIPAFRQVTTQHISERYEGDVGEVFFAMHGYRSEMGR